MDQRTRGRTKPLIELRIRNYYQGNMFGNFLFRLVNKTYEHFNLRQKIYNLSAISSLCIKAFGKPIF